jgi:hypothetical protein
MMTGSRGFDRWMLLFGATQWFLVGSTLSDVLRGGEEQSMGHVKIVLLIVSSLGGIISLVGLWLAEPWGAAGRTSKIESQHVG